MCWSAKLHQRLPTRPRMKLYRCEASPLELIPLKMLLTSVPFT
jgi:hypothetical protein